MTKHAHTPSVEEVLEALLNWHVTKSPDFAFLDQLIKDGWAAFAAKDGQ